MYFSFGANLSPSPSLPWQGQATRGGEQFPNLREGEQLPTGNWSVAEKVEA
jgi:hypothetical protein